MNLYEHSRVNLNKKQENETPVRYFYIQSREVFSSTLNNLKNFFAFKWNSQASEFLKG